MMNEELFNRKLKGQKGFCVSSEIFKGIKECKTRLLAPDEFELFDLGHAYGYNFSCLWQTPELQLLEIMYGAVDYVCLDDTIIDIMKGNKALYFLTTRAGEVIRYSNLNFIHDIFIIHKMRSFLEDHFPELLDDFEGVVTL